MSLNVIPNHNAKMVEKEVAHLYANEKGYLANAVRDGYAMDKVWLHRDEVEEVIQDGVLYALSKKDQFDPSMGILKSWVYNQVKFGANASARRSKSRINLNKYSGVLDGTGLGLAIDSMSDTNINISEDIDSISYYPIRGHLIDDEEIKAICEPQTKSGILTSKQHKLIEEVRVKMTNLMDAIDNRSSVSIRTTGGNIIRGRVIRGGLRVGMVAIQINDRFVTEVKINEIKWVAMSNKDVGVCV